MTNPVYDCPQCEGEVPCPDDVWYGDRDECDCPECGARLRFHADADCDEDGFFDQSSFELAVKP